MELILQIKPLFQSGKKGRWTCTAFKVANLGGSFTHGGMGYVLSYFKINLSILSRHDYNVILILLYNFVTNYELILCILRYECWNPAYLLDGSRCTYARTERYAPYGKPLQDSDG
jgi:hypothetical protein